MGVLTQTELDTWYTPKNTMEQERTLLHAIKEVEEEERPCEECNGTGTVTIQTAPDDEHTRKCICRIYDEEYDEQ